MLWNSCQRHLKSHFIVAFLFALASFGQSARLLAQALNPAGHPTALTRSSLTDPAIEKRVDALLKQMTLEEKVGQLAQYSSGAPTGPNAGKADYPSMIARGEVGSLFNLDSAHAANQYQHIAVEKSRLHIPLLFGLDVIHGFRTTFPVPLALASTWDPSIVEKAARIAAQESSAAGVRWAFSPMVDIARDPRWGRIVEGAGEDPYLGSVMARAYVRGYQGNSLRDKESIAACVKHFVGYGAVEGGRDYNTAEISEHTLREVYLPPFYAAIREGSASVMSSFNTINGLPATANPFTLTQILRKEWEFPGLVVSDWTSVGELVAHGIALDKSGAARKAMNAGVDMDMVSDSYHPHLADLVKSGKVSQARLDAAVRDVLRVKFALGLFEDPFTDESREIQGALPKERLEAARLAAELSFVLLKNSVVGSRPVLPLTAESGTIALIGPLADDARNMLGAWGGRGRPEDVVTLKMALEQRVGAEKIQYAKGGELQNSSDAEIQKAVETAKQAEVVLIALGEEASEQTGEAASRVYLNLPGRQQELLEKVTATGKPVVLLLFSGRPLTLPWEFEHVPAILAAWFPGIQAGPALVRVLFGDVAPSGKLVVSWPRTIGQIPIYYNALNTGRPAGSTDLTHPPGNSLEKYVSRYIDEVNSPQFPFGFGLSYSSLEYSQTHVDSAKLSASALNANLRRAATDNALHATASANVKNTGNRAVDEIVQLYIRLTGTSMEEPVRQLVGFKRISLAPGESQTVSFPLSAETFSLWDMQNILRVEPSHVQLWISPDSSRGLPVELEIVE
ncbi:MAG TPA: glycoside hydrolase family 3 N-terminal domain-containing protein [Candidatus Acidoferrales bacterium]|nr:glycoside hydrolase family 3 N-terminal domain-containing protein [Candidatus Acidoferrales bacterium]